jgi:4-diphosphocytidyl-2-C-methyl-D-erythritol kinase
LEEIGSDDVFLCKRTEMVIFPKAKINIGLNITEKRTDGFHNIETIFYAIGLCDILEFVVYDKKEKKDFFEVSGISIGTDPADNLVLRAVVRLREKYSIPYLKIHLHKVIPIGAGLGGGSSDASCILKNLAKKFDLPLSTEDLKNEALALGSDCPFFIDPAPAFASGRGEILEKIPQMLSGYYLVLLNPGVGINTREAYQNCHPQIPEENLKDLIVRPPDTWKGIIKNDFENYAFQKHPVIGEIKNQLYTDGAIFSLMSGSGSSVYGIFNGKPELSPALKKFLIWQGSL